MNLLGLARSLHHSTPNHLTYAEHAGEYLALHFDSGTEGVSSGSGGVLDLRPGTPP